MSVIYWIIVAVAVIIQIIPLYWNIKNNRRMDKIKFPVRPNPFYRYLPANPTIFNTIDDEALENIRFEIIDELGRSYVRYNADLKFSVQDDNKTLKVFVTKHRTNDGKEKVI